MASSCSAAGSLSCGAAVSEMTPGSSRVGEEEIVAFGGVGVNDWISMLKHDSQMGVSWKGLGVGENGKYKDQPEKDGKESPKRLRGGGEDSGWKEGNT